jgi:hypothetical protein
MAESRAGLAPFASMGCGALPASALPASAVTTTYARPVRVVARYVQAKSPTDRPWRAPRLGGWVGSRHRLLREAGGGALGELESGPDVHVDDDPDDLEDLLR